MMEDANHDLVIKDGRLDPDSLARFVRRSTRMGLSPEEAAKLAAYK